MADQHYKKASKISSTRSKSRVKKLLNFFLHLSAKKSKKSLFSVISHLLESYEKEGLIGHEEKKMFRNIVSFGDKVVSDFMTPRTDVIMLNQGATLEDVKSTVTTNGHTRIPVYRDNLDDVVGFIHSKDLVKFLCDANSDFSILKILRKILFVPGSMKLLDVMMRMRMARVHAAIVLDEFGGMNGFITIENIMEQIVGDIEDEHDLPSESSFFRIKKIDDQTFQFGGRVEIEKFEEILQTKIKEADDEFQTVSGLTMAIFNRVPEVDEEAHKYGFKFKIIDSDSRLVKLVEVRAVA